MVEKNNDEFDKICFEDIEFEKEEMIIPTNVQMMAKDSSKSHAG